MSRIDVKVKQGRVQSEKTELLVLMHFQDSPNLHGEATLVDKRLQGALQRLIKNEEFEGKANQTVLFHSPSRLPVKRVLLLGLGKKAEANLDTVRQAMGVAVKRVRQTGVDSFHVTLPSQGLTSVSNVARTQAAVEGCILGTYEFSLFKTESKPKKRRLRTVTFMTADTSTLRDMKEGVKRGCASADSTWLVRDLSNHPSNLMTPSLIVEQARMVAKESGVSLKVLEQKDMERLGMGALLGVARGSQEPPKFLIFEYQGVRARKGSKAAAPIVLVGKTVTFDTGGISLKGAENMERMKADMTGGAEVMATIRAIARLRLPIHVLALLPATENMPGGRAIKPGDVLKTLSGKTVEVQNTDAEGRLILADGLAYATRYQPKAIIDVATLTGACSVALGKFAIGMFGNQESLKGRIQVAGETAGERVWEMPLWPEYFEQLKSDVADMRNIGGRGGGMITAALFLSKFVGKFPWIHLDIASVDWNESERPYLSKGPTGIGTRLLLQFLIQEAEAGD